MPRVGLPPTGLPCPVFFFFGGSGAEDRAQTLTVQTDDGIVGLIFKLIEEDREKDRGKVLTSEIDREIDRGKVLAPGKDCKMDQDKVLGTDLRFLEKSR